MTRHPTKRAVVKTKWRCAVKNPPKWPRDVPFLARDNHGNIWVENTYRHMHNDPTPLNFNNWPLKSWMPIPK